MSKNKTIVRSPAVAASEMRSLLNRLCGLEPDISVTNDYLVCSGQILDPGFHFRATFSTPMPVSFENFDSVPDSLVMFDRTSPLRGSVDVASELCTVVHETGQWFRDGYSTLRDYVISDASMGIVILLTAMRESDVWRLRWRSINNSSFLSLNKPTKRLAMLNFFLDSLASEMGMESCHAVLDGNFVVGLDAQHSRVLIHDSAAVFGEQLERYELQLEFATKELDGMLKAFATFCDEFNVRARVTDGHGMPRDRYERWLQDFDFRPACYDYMYNGYVLPHAVDFFAFNTEQIPKGVVPFAKIGVRAEGSHLGVVEVACQFADSNCTAIFSGENEEAILKLCALGGFAESEIVYS